MPLSGLHIDTCILKRLLDTFGGKGNHLPLMAFDRSEIRTRLTCRNAEALQFLEVHVLPAASQERLCRNTAPMCACAAPLISLDDGNPGSTSGRVFSRRMASGAGSNNDKIVYTRHYKAFLDSV
jgi:hypothetical protein